VNQDFTAALALRRRSEMREATRFVRDTTEALSRTPFPPIQPASTVFFGSVDELRRAEATPLEGFFYGGMGTPAVAALEAAMARLEGGEAATATSSGNAAIAAALVAVLPRGGHLLATGAAYVGLRRLCAGLLRGMGVETEFYAPGTGGGIARLIRPDTRAIWLESPGTFSMAVEDVPAICAAARRAGIATLMDNSWGAFGLFEPFRHGVDISVVSAGKGASGHSDLMLGAVIATRRHAAAVKEAVVALGQAPGSLESFLALRGLRTLAVRRDAQERAGLHLAEWFAGRPEVARVLHPSLPDFPGHALWRRDFRGAAGVFTVAFRDACRAHAVAALDRLRLTRLGYGWGGTESLALPCLDPASHAPAAPEGEFWVRLSAGLEDPRDLIDDWDEALAGDGAPAVHDAPCTELQPGLRASISGA
jgi:cystathionine beta-lyase